MVSLVSMLPVQVFTGSPLTFSFGLACRDHTFDGNAFIQPTFSKSLCFRFRAVVFNLGPFSFFL